jgi:ketosteroid isomerase-like protein
MNPVHEHGGPAADSGRPEQRILSMTPERAASASIDSILHQRIDDLAQAIRDRDIDRLISFYASDVVVFDVRPPLDVRGAAAYRHNFERWFASFEGRLDFDLHELRIAPGEFTAFCHYLALVVGQKAGGRTSGYWVRGTTGFERRDGDWLITHEHISMPSPA